jgi:hypothetical protein
VIGYVVGAIVGCDWLYPTSNLCGIYGAFPRLPRRRDGGVDGRAVSPGMI